MLLALITPSFAATLSVGTTFATIGEAISAASSGDTILVAPGTWAESLDLGGKSLTILGAGPDATFVAPSTGADAIVVAAGETGSIADLTIVPVGGRGLVVTNSTVTLTDVTIDHAGSDTSRGGGIAIDGGTLTLDEVTLSGNLAAYGAGVYATGRATVTATALTVSGGEASYGGAIFANDNTTLTLDDVLAVAPYATYDGGFAYLDGATLTATDLTVDAPSGHTSNGIGVYAIGYSQVDLDGGTLTNAALDLASSAVVGGALFFGEGSSATLTDLTLSDNTASAGAALYLEGSAAGALTDVRFETNVAAGNGGALRAVGSSVVFLEACTFEGNTADAGGAISLEDGSALWDDGSTLTDNESTAAGGAIQVTTGASLALDATIVSSNTARSDGGGLYVAEGTVDGRGIEVTFNLARNGSGGGLHVATGTLTVTDGRVEGNEARLGSGGGVYSEGAASFSTTRFTDNVARDDGGALWLSGVGAVWEGTLFWNRAGDDGGAVRGSGQVTLARSYLHANTAADGGAVYLADLGAGGLTNLRLTDNAATGTGGAVALEGGFVQVEVVNNTFAGNDAGTSGGHLYTTAAVSLVNNVFYEAIDGGGVYGTTEGTSDRYYNLTWENAGGDWVGWSDPTGESGNLAEDPRLAAYTADGDPTDDNLFLEPGSPAIDVGSPALFDVDGSRSDLGAFGGADADVQDADADGFYDNTDCDDDDAAISPAAAEVPYDAVDQDCDGSDLEDLDGDGFGASVVGGGDCDDTNADIWPDAPETWYDGVDSDCSETSDFDQDGDWHDAIFAGGDDCDDLDITIHGAAVEEWYDGVDQDCDGWSDFDRDRDGVDAQTYGGADCDDYNAARTPGRTEVPYDGIDQDCSGDDLVDVDEDGWIAVEAGGTDCNDAEATVYPGAYEDPTDGFDTDCDGYSEWDRDGDGYDAEAYGGGDCDDDDADRNPGATETWYDGLDQDCDGRDDDQDGDGYLVADDCDDTNPAIHPGATEQLDGLDDDCDGWSEVDDQDRDGLNGVVEWILGTDPLNPDSDGDTLADGLEVDAGPDRDHDLHVDALDDDDDGDGIATLDEQTYDLDRDGAVDTDVDADGVRNAWDDDSDGDGYDDWEEGTGDSDGDGAPDFLDYQGDLVGGGCGGASWAGIVLPLGIVRWRWLLALLLGLLPARARAVDAHGFTLLGTSGSSTTYTRLGEAGAGEAGDWAVGTVIDYADTPLAETFPWGREPVLASLATVNVAGSYSFGGLVVDAVLPFYAVGVDPSGTFTTPGDARLGVRVPAWTQLGMRPAVAVQALGFLPTGAEAHYLGTTGPRVGAVGIVQEEIGPIGLLAMAGGQVGFAEEDRNLHGGLGPMLGVGAAYRISDALSVSSELTAESTLTSIPVEASLSARYRLRAGAWATVGGATGIGAGVGASQWRAIAGVGWSYRKPEPVAVLAPAWPPVDPNADRDGDGIVDTADRCPDQAETVDGYLDEDGCPELDGDGDGVPFDRDQCVTEPIRPEQDPRWSDGCPQVAEFAGDHIAITEAIFFAEGRAEILPSSERVLGAVRAVMLAHPEVEYFLVEGHTNTNGSDVFNLRLSDARAYAVATWLVTHDIPAARLLSKGFGEGRPLVADTDPDALAINRRVEFRVVKVEQIPADARRLQLPPEIRK